MADYNKKRRKKYRILILIVVIVLLVVAVTFLPKCLYKERITDAEVLVVEGWLPEYAMVKAIETFNSGNYKVLVTTGSRLPCDFNMHSSGTLVFDLKNTFPDSTSKWINTIKVNAYGSKADGEYSHFQLFINDSLVGNSYVNKRKSEHVFHIEKRIDNINKLMIKFDNDTYTKWRDRNLFIEYVVIGDIKIKARSKAVIYNMKWIDGYEEFSPRFDNTADYAAFVLKYIGFKDSIISIPVLSSKVSRTYSCARAFREWYTGSDYNNKPVNILSLGPHTRRTWMIYKKVLGKDNDVGIILVNDKNFNKKNWWKSLTGIKDTIYEMAGCIYILIVFLFLA